MKIPFFLCLFLFSSGFIFAQKSTEIFNEQHRPQFHFTPEKNWMNDPNGLVYYKGEYHLFYQYNPYGKEHGYMHWGHAISTDLVHWEHLPVAVTPDNDSKDIETCTAFSGCGLVDHENITGLKKGDQETILLFYTSRNCGQRLAYSNDKGRTWTKYEKNPLIEFDETDDARDPKVIWHAPSRQYVMLLYRRPNNNEKDRGFSIYTSKNLIDWEYKSHLAGFFECPDLVELAVNRRSDDKKWVLFDGDGSYIIGNFDGDKFVPESPKLLSDYGKNYYATQTWSNIPETDGRCIQIAWMKGGEYPEMPFTGQLTFPCELSLKKFPEGIKLLRKPIKEIEKLHLKGEVYEDKNLIPGLNKNLTDNIKGDCLHIIGTFKLKSADNFGFITRLDKENNGFEINYDVKNSTISCFGKTVKLKPIDGIIKLEILIDRTSVELFANDGELAMTTTYNTTNKKATGLYFFNTGGEIFVEKLEIYPMKSMWIKPEEQKKEKKK